MKLGEALQLRSDHRKRSTELQLRKRADAYARLRRELDVKIQQANWEVDLVDRACTTASR